LADDIEVALLEELGDGSVQLVRTGVSHEGELRLVAAIAPTQKLFVRVNREGQVVRLLEEPIYEIQYNYE
jgi:hypothetical protein